MTLPDMMHACGEREPPGILRVAAVDDEAERAHLPPRFLFQLDPPHRLQIDGGDLFAGAEIGNRFGARRGGDAKSDAAAHAAAIETEHETRPLRRAAMNERIDAKRPMQADEPRRHALEKVETGTPHQRTVAEHPKVGVFVRIDEIGHPR